MAIYRGFGGAGDANNTVSVNEIEQFANAANFSKQYAEEWATKAEDSLVSTEAGGDGSTDYSSLHHSAKASIAQTASEVAQAAAEAAQALAETAETNASNSASNASTSEANALASELAAAASAATIPVYDTLSGEALNFVRLNAGETSMEFRTPAEVLSDIGAEPADATILKDADIGVTVQAYDDTLEVGATADQIASEVPNTPSGNISATDVQSAISELDTEKAGLALANVFTERQRISMSAPALDFFETDQAADSGMWTIIPNQGNFDIRTSDDSGVQQDIIFRIQRGGLIRLLKGQLEFPSAQNASADSNTLDDYEEGTWTPGMQGVTTAGNPTFSIRAGYYTKVGNLVSLTGRIILTSKGGMVGALEITGLPFSTTGASSSHASGVIGYMINANITSGTTVSFYSNVASSSMKMRNWDDAGGNSSLIDTDITDTTDFMFSISYRV